MRATRRVTVEELWEMPEKRGTRYELVRGELVEVPGAGALHGLIAKLILKLVDAFVEERDLGLVFGDNLGYVLGRDPDTLRIPDASFVSWDRVPEGGVPDGYWPGAPDLAVEIVSPNDRADDVHDKVREYLEAGTKTVWVLWPKHRSVTANIGLDGTARDLGSGNELNGGDALPGFRARVGDLFEVRRAR